tara:strand:- start:15720 stop:16013 length:294 start_codon:yes stop_codon:yes gene_type:complete
MSKEVPAKELLDSAKVGDRITILIPNGRGLKGQEWKQKTGRCVITPNPILDPVGRPSGVVLNMGGNHGTPGVADERNIVRIGQRIATPVITDQPRED